MTSLEAWQGLVIVVGTTVELLEIAEKEERLSACEDLGANVVVNYKTEDSVARLKKETRAKVATACIAAGVNVIMDRNLNSRSIDKRIFFMGGAIVEVNLNSMITISLNSELVNIFIDLLTLY
ncbi:hypothetical protein AHAS_Ahas16G0218600 [Arachis hypogaea]